MNQEITREIHNFDALGLFASQELRDVIMDNLPCWHYEGISLISYAPERFLHVNVPVGFVASGLYVKNAREIYINRFQELDLRKKLENLRMELDRESDVMDSLGKKREVVQTADGQFVHEKKQVFEVAFHEIGHHVYARQSVSDAGFVSRWNTLFRIAKDHVTDYAATDAEENFAECYMSFVCNRKLLARNYRAEFNAIESLFK